MKTYVALRWTISGSGCLLIALWLYPKSFPRRETLFRLGVLGMWAYGVSSMGTLHGLKTGGVIHFALVSNVSPVNYALLSLYFL